MTEIVTLTLNPALDKNARISRVLPDRKLRCEGPEYEPGGGGINVSRAIHRLGGRSTAFWPCGGPIGELCSQLLDEEGIDHRPISIEKMTRENLIVYEEETNQQFRFGMPGAELDSMEWSRCRTTIRNLDPTVTNYLVVSGSLPPGVTNPDLLDLINDCPDGIRIILDPSGEPIRSVPDHPVFLLKPNLRELSRLSGQEIQGDETIRRASRSLLDRGLSEAVLTSLGSAGVVLVTRQEEHVVRAPTVPIQSKVGAGDSAVAGVIVALSRGQSLLDAVKFGVAAGSAAVMTPGSELCRRSDTERLFAELSGRSTEKVHINTL